MWESVIVFLLAILLAYPLGNYLAAVMQGQPMSTDKLFRWVEQPIYRLLSVSPQKLEWEHDDLSEKTFTITTYSNQSWQIVEQ